MRRKTGLLLTRDGAPEGGQWNYDQENRSPIDRHYRAPTRLRFATDDITNTVIEMVASRFAEHFGDHHGFDWAVTRTDALAALDHFIKDALPSFGTYQDAMARDEPFLSHGLISFYLNAGLLVPMEVCKAAERAYHGGSAPLHAVEGFIRQVLGWREYVRGIYWQNMPGYDDLNALNASGALPELYWTGQTRMACMAAVIDQTRRHAYAHHIQRLMVTGNFALLAGIAPRAVNEWYMSVFGDAYEWVELPNTHGMALFADGGIMASKPYAASGQYIHRMSDYCASCAYSVSRKTGDAACPFNYLYWDFMARNRSILSQNPRISRQYFTYDRMAPEQQRDIAESSAKFLRGIGVTKAEECST
jgi:deoxyribodipyrimidine photolyase-related protein